jgi:putative membrane protein
MDNQAILVKKLDKWAIGVSAFVLVAVIILRYMPQLGEDVLPFDIHLLPRLHAILNSLAAVSLLAALWFVKQKNITMHKRMIVTAMVLSALFLVSYVVYHALTEPTKFGGEGAIKVVYFFLLATHVILAAAILPFILLTFIRGYTMQIPAHKRLARWTFPLWLYVALTGPVCYLMLMPYY